MKNSRMRSNQKGGKREASTRGIFREQREAGRFGGWLVGGFRGWWRHPVYPD